MLKIDLLAEYLYESDDNHIYRVANLLDCNFHREEGLDESVVLVLVNSISTAGGDLSSWFGLKRDLGTAATTAPISQTHQVSSRPSNVPSLSRVIKKCIKDFQAEDTSNIFRNPVTEKIAPNYFTIIKYPMDILTMFNKAKDDKMVTYLHCLIVHSFFYTPS
jgi:hypothetical protein